MDNTEIEKIVDSDRWLLNNGLVSDNVKNQLFFCGSIVHKDVRAVELKIQPETKSVDYIIFIPSELLEKVKKYRALSMSKSVFGMWRFKRFLKREGCLDFQKILNSFVKDYCGPKWIATATIIDFDVYVDNIEVENEDGGESDKSSDNG